MRIIGVEVIPLTFSWKRIIQETFGPVGKREDDVVLRLHTDDGLTGLGEAMTLGPWYSMESQGTVMSLLAEHIGPKVLLSEDPFNVDLIHHKMDSLVSEHSIAKTAVDFALYDLMGKALGVPVYRLLGGAYTDRIKLRWGLGIGTAEQMVEESLDGIRAGYRALKIKVGLDPEQDIKNLKAIRHAVGDEIPITVDINQGYDPKTAIRVIRKMEEFGIQLVEQPVHRRDLDGMALVRRSVETPIGACESAISIHDVVQVLKKEAADFLNFKVSRSGGFYRGKAIVQMVSAAGMFVVGSTQLGMGIELAADAHFAAATIQVGPPPFQYHGYGSGMLKLFNTTDSRGITRDIVDGTPLIENGLLRVSPAPGLGVELNESAVREYLTPSKEPLVIGEGVTEKEVAGSR